MQQLPLTTPPNWPAPLWHPHSRCSYPPEPVSRRTCHESDHPPAQCPGRFLPARSRLYAGLHARIRNRPGPPGRPTGSLRPAGSSGPERRPGRRAVAPAGPLHPAEELDERPQRARLLRRRVPHVLPVQPRGLGLGQHVLGSRGLQGPGPLGGAGRGDPAHLPVRGVLRLGGHRHQEHLRPGQPGQPGHGRGVDAGRRRRQPVPVTGLLHGQGPHLEAVQQRGPGPGHRLQRVPRPEGLLGRDVRTLDHGGLPRHRAPHLLLLLPRPHPLDRAVQLRRGGHHLGGVGVPGLLPAAGRRQLQGGQVGPRGHGGRLRPVLRGQLGRLHLHPRRDPPLHR